MSRLSPEELQEAIDEARKNTSCKGYEVAKCRDRHPRRLRCTICGATINLNEEFNDKLSIREFFISGVCQSCQNSVFGG